MNLNYLKKVVIKQIEMDKIINIYGSEIEMATTYLESFEPISVFSLKNSNLILRKFSAKKSKFKAIIISITSILILVFWEDLFSKKYKVLKFVQAPLVVVLVGK